MTTASRQTVLGIFDEAQPQQFYLNLTLKPRFVIDFCAIV